MLELNRIKRGTPFGRERERERSRGMRGRGKVKSSGVL
jgi:hypothetical protein